MSLFTKFCDLFRKRQALTLPTPGIDPDPDTSPTAVPIERTDRPTDPTDPEILIPVASPSAPPIPVVTGPTPPAPPFVVPRPPAADLDPEKRRIVWSILSVFETGRPEGDYSAVAVLRDGAGFSYGKHQAIDRSDTLDAIVLRYLDLGGGRYGEDLRPFLDYLSEDASTRLDPERLASWPTEARELMILLQKAGDDPVMRRAQDEIFSEMYWDPCRKKCLAMGLVLPLSWAATYDTTIQSGPTGIDNIRKRFAQSPPASGGDERAWTRAYLEARQLWISRFHNPEHPERNATVQSTTYRTESLLDLCDAGNWELATPVQISRPRAVIV